MQAIARVNRVFRDKPAGLVVDYIGIAQNLKSALGQYSGGGPGAGRHRRGRSRRGAAGEVRGRAAMFHGFDYRRGLRRALRTERLGRVWPRRIDWILTLQQEEAAKETTDEGKKRAHRRYQDAVLALSKAFALAAASDEAREIRDEVGFFQTVRAALVKTRDRRRQDQLGRPRTGHPADRQPRRRLDRDRRHPARRPGSQRRISRSCPTSSWPRCSRWRRRTSPWRRCGSS